MPSPGPASPCGVDITGYYVDHNHDDRYPRTDNAKIAYAWMCHSVSTIDVTMDVTTCGGGGQQYAFNPAGGAITSTRFAVGRYDVVFHGLSMSGGNVQVTAYSQTATNTDWCKIASWGASVAKVNCFTITGNAVDTQFTVTMMD